MFRQATQWLGELDKAYKVAAVVIGALSAAMVVTRKIEGLTTIAPAIDSLRSEMQLHRLESARWGSLMVREQHKMYCVSAFKTPMGQRDCLLADPTKEDAQ